MTKKELLKKVSPVVLSAAVALTSMPSAVLAAEFTDSTAVTGEDTAAVESAEASDEISVEEAADAETEPVEEETSDVDIVAEESEETVPAEDAAAEAAEETADDAAAAEEFTAEVDEFTDEAGEDGYVYGTVNLPFADFYYGELNNNVAENAAMDLTVADKVTAAGYRDSGMYDVVTSATGSKAKNYGTSYYTVAEDGKTVNIEGIKNVNIAVPKTLYDAATAAIAAGEKCSNQLLNIVGSMTVSESAPASGEYKILNGDGTLTAMKSEVKTVEGASAAVTTLTNYGEYQVNVDFGSEATPVTRGDDANVLAIIFETSDGSKYGMEQSENQWFKSGEIGFAVTEDMTIHGNTVQHQRHAGMEGKTITKITYLLKDAADLVINTSLYLKYQVDTKTQNITGAEGVVYADGAQVKMTRNNLPEKSAYALSSVTYGKKTLTAGTDYSYDAAADTLTIKKTENTGVGTYTLVYQDASYEDLQTTVVLDSGMTEGSVKIVDNKLVVESDTFTLADYLNNLSGITINDKTNNASAAAAAFNKDGSVNFAASVSAHGNTTVVFPEAMGTEYSITVTSTGFPSVSGKVAEEVVYGTANVSYADYFYGELKSAARNSTMDLEAADKVAAAGYREDGMYDTITCATNSKSMKYASAWGEVKGDGAELYGIKDVNIAVPKTLYDAATAAIKEGKTCNNKLFDIINSLQNISETAPASGEYKVLNGDGTLTAMKTETKNITDGSVSVSADSVWGEYQVDVNFGASAQKPSTDALLGIIVETTDGAKYGMLHSQNTWLQTQEFAFAVNAGFTEPHGNTIDYKRFADIQGKTIAKVTYLVKDGADLVVNADASAVFKNLLTKDQGITASSGVVYADGAKVQMTRTVPADSKYQLASVSFGGNILTAGTDYTYENDVFTVKNTDKTGVGTYTFTYTDETYKDITVEVILESGLKDGDVTLTDGKLVLNSKTYTAADYLAAATGVKVDGTAQGGRHAVGSDVAATIFNKDGSVNFKAAFSGANGDTPVFTKADGSSYEMELTAAGFPAVKGTVYQNASLKLNVTAKTLYTKVTNTVTLKVTSNMSGTATWKSSNTGVAAVDKNGKVTAKKAGTATVTATLNGKTVSCKITVKNPSITAKAKAATIYTKGTTSTTVTVTKNGVSGTAKFSTSNSKIATVSSKGVVKAKKAGTVKITVKVKSTADKKTYSKTITIKVKAPSLTLTKSSASIKAGKTTTIKAKAAPTGKITYKSSNKKVATVSSKGVVKGVKKGTASITVTCNGVSKTFKVTVK